MRSLDGAYENAGSMSGEASVPGGALGDWCRGLKDRGVDYA